MIDTLGWNGSTNHTSPPPHHPPSKSEAHLEKIFQTTRLFSPWRFASLCSFPLSLKWRCVKRGVLVGIYVCKWNWTENDGESN